MLVRIQFWFKIMKFFIKTLIIFLKTLIIIIPFLISVAFFTIAERKIMGSIQIRKGPNVVGFLGLLQPFSDGLKLFIKETVIPNSSNEFFFILAPVLGLILSLISWSLIPYGFGCFLADINLAIIFIFCISSLNLYTFLFSGWGSNSKYAFIGAVRVIAQMISYELSFTFAVLILIISSSSFNFSKIIVSQYHCYYLITFFPLFLIFYIIILAETNRHPFDLAEAEAELVSGYNVEYSSMTFANFFLSEYGNMLLMSSLGAILFFGSWLIFIIFEIFPGSLILSLKICFGIIHFILNRAVLPRFRFDQLMELGWFFLFPFLLGYFLSFIAVITNFNGLNHNNV